MSTDVVQYLTFAGNVCARSSSVVNWSESNVIAFCTDEGIHLLEPAVHAFSIDSSFPIAIHRYFIAAPTQPNVFEFGIDRQELHSTAPRSEVFDLMLDRTLSPAVSCQQSYKGFRQSAWSSLGLGPLQSCVLATLTMDHRLTLYVNDSRSWVNTAELSQLYYNYLKSLDFKMDWMKPSDDDIRYESEKLNELKLKSYATAATDMVWSRSMWTSTAVVKSGASMPLYSILGVGMKNGSVVLWKVQQFTSTTLIPASHSMSVGIVFDGLVGLVRSMCWIELELNFSALLIVGGSLGKIRVFFVSHNSEDALSVVETFTLWLDNDRLDVTQISYSKVSDDLFNVVAGKGSFIIAWKINKKTVLKKTHVGGNFIQPLVGLFPEDEKNFIGASADGLLFQITLEDSDKKGFTLNLVKRLSDIENEHMNYFGLSVSKNGFLFCFVEGIVSWHDHLIIREPFKLMFATCKDIDVRLKEILNEIDQPEARLHLISDALHAIHYYLIKNKELPPALVTLLKDIDSVPSLELSTCQLQLTRWLLRLFIFTEPDEENAKQYKLKLHDVEVLLLERQLLSVLQMVTEQLGTHGNVTVKTLSSSISVACHWLRSRPVNHLSDAQRKLLQIVSNQLGLSSSIDDQATISEECRLCHKYILHITFHFIKEGKCESGHSFGRCALTLSICDQPFYRKCRKCSVLASCDLFDLLKEIRCPYCSILL